jgi:hypothetical protein
MKFLKSNTAKFILRFTVSVVLISLIFRYVGFNKVYSELSNANIYYVFIALFFTIFLVFFKALRWKTVMAIFSTNLKIWPSLKYTLISITFGMITPSKVGEFIKGKYLADKTKISYLRSFTTVIVDKAFDIMAVIFLALLGLSMLKETAEWSNLFIGGFIGYLLLLILIFIYIDKAIKWGSYFLPKRVRERFSKVFMTRKIYLSSIIISLLVWVILSIQAFFIMLALGIPSSLFVTITIVPLMAIATLIPVSIGGIGVREVIAIYSLLIIEVSPEKSAIFSLIYTFIGAGVPAIIGIFLYLFHKKESTV